jgi:hypothetical protein
MLRPARANSMIRRRYSAGYGGWVCGMVILLLPLSPTPSTKPGQLHPGAAASLSEGLEETLTVMRLGLPENLERVLSSTNLIENLFGRVREIGRRVRRWQNGTMVLGWTAAGVLEAERGFPQNGRLSRIADPGRALRNHDTTSRP